MRCSHTLILAALLSGAFIVPALAQDAAAPAESRAQLLDIARQFVDRIGAGFEKADRDIAQGYIPGAPSEFKGIPDGELLLLQVRLGRYRLEQPVTAIKMGRDVMLSLTDFATVARFAINVDAPSGIAEGWYIREDQPFRLDVNAGTIVADDETYSIADGDVLVEEGDIRVRGQALAEWMDFELETSLMSQSIEIASEQKWPLLERMERRSRKPSTNIPPPSLPRQDEPYQLASIPRADISLTQRYRRPGDGGEVIKESNYTVEASGDFLNHTTRAVITGNKEEKFGAARVSMRKESDKQDLLGPLKAQRYDFGDISSINVSGAGGGSGVGVRATNRTPYVTSGTETELEGEATPGWDVELYRGGQYISGLVVGDDGRYRFEDVRLFGGENQFRIVHYGPLGEIREDEHVLYSDPSLVDAAKGQYEVSVVAADTALWTRTPSDGPDKRTPIIAGTYERQITDNLSLKTGLLTRQNEEEQKTFLYAGTATSIDGTLLNLDGTYDLEGTYRSSITTRRRFGEHNALIQADYVTTDYGAAGDATSPSEYTLEAALRGPVPYLYDKKNRFSYDMESEYTENELNESSHRSSLGLSARAGNLSLSNTLSHSVRTESEGESTESLSGSTSVRGRALGTSWRAGALYGINPESKIQSYQLGATRPLTRHVRLSASMTHNPETDFNTYSGSLSWRTKHVQISPNFNYDTDNNLGMNLNLNFGLAYNSYNKDLMMVGRDIADFGGVSAFVYLDKNGDMVFNDGDMPLPDITVESLHTQSRATTGEDGEAYIYDMPLNRITDVALQEASFSDPFWIPARPGVSVRPRAGHVSRIEFPVHMSGEIDGTVYARTPDGEGRPLRNMHVQIYNLDGRLVQTASTAFDGFYLLTRIPPGDYYLIVDGRDARNNRLERPAPQMVHVGYEGTIIYGNNIYLESGTADIPVAVAGDLADYAKMNPSLNEKALAGSRVALNLGSYNSRVLMVLNWYTLKTRYAPILQGGDILVQPSESYAAVETGQHTLRVALPGETLVRAYNRCRALMARDMYCAVEIIPQDAQKQAAADLPAKG